MYYLIQDTFLNFGRYSKHSRLKLQSINTYFVYYIGTYIPNNFPGPDCHTIFARPQIVRQSWANELTEQWRCFLLHFPYFSLLSKLHSSTVQVYGVTQVEKTESPSSNLFHLKIECLGNHARKYLKMQQGLIIQSSFQQTEPKLLSIQVASK